ncbi:hypothetical protein ACFUIY_02860 [Streptomyces griseorubiginosus]|uniref:hypothetical protein n=1 Tax=Streptomyces griseorubiginosus TaxID=67304 RepID=UPI0036324C2D
MSPTEILNKVKTAFPRAAAAGLDFTIPLGDCEASFYCMSNTRLEFRVKTVASGASPGGPRVVTSTQMLITSTNVLWDGLEKSLKVSRFRARPSLNGCHIEDVQSRNKLLFCDMSSPLWSAGAKVAYIVSGICAIAAAALILWQLQTQHDSNSQQANILGISLGLLLPAITTPIPVIVNWLEWKKQLTWKFVRSAQ